MSGIRFGVEPNMREVPPGEHAVVKLQHFNTWTIKETEYGEKFCIPIILFSHPSYESIPSKGMKVDWVSKSRASQDVFFWLYDKARYESDGELQVHTFDFDIEKELKKKWKLIRHETGGYAIEQI